MNEIFCIKKYYIVTGSCGTHGAIWSDEPMPIVIGKPARVKVYGAWSNGCKDFNYTISVMRCSYSMFDLIYNYNGPNGCQRGFCGSF